MHLFCYDTIDSKDENEMDNEEDVMGYSIFDSTMVDLSWTEVEREIKEGAIVLMPTGVIEAHGPHMCLGVDTYGSYIQSILVKKALDGQGIRTLIAPPNYWGINSMTGAFPGSFTLRPTTYKALIYDFMNSLKNWGVKYVFNINHHGDVVHCHTLFEGIKVSRESLGIKAYSIVSDFDCKRLGLNGDENHILVNTQPQINDESNGSKYIDIHAGAGETSMMVRYFPNQVNLEIAKSLQSTDLLYPDVVEWRKGGDIARGVTPLCYLGDPASYNLSDCCMEDDAMRMAGLITWVLDRAKSTGDQ